MENPRLAAALDYLARGWSVIPLCPHDHEDVPKQHAEKCKSPGKAPLWPWKDYQERLPKESEAKFFWKRNPNCNIGIAMGPVSGLLGIDIDGPAGHDLFAKMSKGEIPKTLEFSTPSGGHRLLFKWPNKELKIKSFAVAGKEAVRILAKGSQTVAPPSDHAAGGQYRWCDGHGPDNISPAECPDWLISYLTADSYQQADPDNLECGPKSTKTNGALAEPVDDGRVRKYLDQCPPAIEHQQGHEQLLKVATGLVKGFSLTPEHAFMFIWAHYNPRCQPPWSEKEIRHKCEEAKKYGNLEDGYLLKQPKPSTKPAEPQDATPRAHIRAFKTVQPKPVEWLWPKWIPLGKLAILDGDPGLGKSTMLLDLAARISTNGIMPDMSHGACGNVLIMSAEDAPEDTIRPRLEAAQANLERVHDLSYVHKNGEDRPPEIPNDLPLIEKRIQEIQARLLVIDPLMAFLYGADANKDQEIRRVLFKLSRIAEKHRCAIVCMRHLNKGGSGKAIYRGNSSIGVIGHARTGLLVAIDPDNDQKRVLAVSKCNLAAKPKSLEFVLEPIGEVCRIAWCGISTYNADALVAPAPTQEEQEQKEDSMNKVAQTRAILEMLMEQYEGSLEIKLGKAECAAAGMTAKHTEKALKELGWDVKYKTDELGKRTYYWTPHTAESNADTFNQSA